MLLGGLVGMPVKMEMRVVFMDMGVFASDFGMRGRKFLAHPARDAGEVENSEQDEHQAHGKFHGESGTRRNDQIKENNGGADNYDGQGVTEAPERADQGSF